MPQVTHQRGTMSAGDTRNVAVDFTDQLDSGELLTGTPTVVEVTTSELTLGSKAVNTSALTILGDTVAIGAAVQFNVACSTIGSYRIRITATSDASPAQTLIVDYLLDVI